MGKRIHADDVAAGGVDCTVGCCHVEVPARDVVRIGIPVYLHPLAWIYAEVPQSFRYLKLLSDLPERLDWIIRTWKKNDDW